MILPIYVDPQPVLHQKTELIPEITSEIRQLITDMRETMQGAEGVGLAAPQIGKSLSLCVIEMYDEDPEYAIPFMAFINPRITWKSKKMVSLSEACLSLPGLEGNVKRPDRIRVKAKNCDGDTIEFEASGFLARVIQHEIDHLHGILFTSFISKKQLKTRPLVDYPQI